MTHFAGRIRSDYHKSKYSNNPTNIALTLLFLAVGIILPFAPLGLIDPGQDECYQALSVRGYESSPLAMLTFYIGNLACSLFGDSLLTLRRLMAACHLLSIGLGCAYLYSKSRDALVSSFLFMVMSAMSTHCTMTIYGWDTGAYPFIVLTLIATLFYISRGNIVSLILLGFSTSLMILARIPTAAILPFYLLIIVWRNRNVRLKGRNYVNKTMREFRDMLTLFLSIIIATVLITHLTFGIENYINAWKPDNIITGHSDIHDYLERILTLAPAALKLWGVVLLMALAGFIIAHLSGGKALTALKFIIFAGALAGAIIAVREINSTTADFGLAQGLLLAVLLYIPVKNICFGAGIPCPSSLLWTVVLFSLLAAVGSNGIVERPLALPLIPIAATAVYPCRNGMLKWLFILAFCLSLKINIGRFVHLYRDQTYSIDAPALDGIRLSNNAYSWLMPVGQTIDSLHAKEKSVGYLGLLKYHLYYIFSDETPALLQIYHYDETRLADLNRAVGELSKADAVIILTNPDYDSNSYEVTANTLQSKGFKRQASPAPSLLFVK